MVQIKPENQTKLDKNRQNKRKLHKLDERSMQSALCFCLTNDDDI